MKRFIVTMFVLLSMAPAATAQMRAKAARETAEFLFQRFGTKAGRSVGELASRIESLAVRHGDEVIIAIRKGGPSACSLIEAAGPNASKAVKVLTIHGEQGASRILSQPRAMNQYLTYGEEAGVVLCRHPGVAEPLVERGGMQAVKALGAVDPQNGRRLAMLMEGELAQSARHPDVLGVVAKHGDSAANFLWQNKGTFAKGAALAVFLDDPEPFLNGTRDIASVAGETVAKPVVEGVFTMLNIALVGVGLAILAAIGLGYKHGPPKAETIKSLFSLFKK